MVVDFYARSDVRAEIDGYVSFREDYYLSYFMKQFLTHNGNFNMPDNSESSSNSLQSNNNDQDDEKSELLEFGGGDYGGNKGFRVYPIDNSKKPIYVSIENQNQYTEHRKNEIDLVLQAKDSSGSTLALLYFSEYFGEVSSCPDGSCNKCKTFKRIDGSSVKCEFSFDGDLQIWFNVKGLDPKSKIGNERGYLWKKRFIAF